VLGRICQLDPIFADGGLAEKEKRSRRQRRPRQSAQILTCRVQKIRCGRPSASAAHPPIMRSSGPGGHFQYGECELLCATRRSYLPVGGNRCLRWFPGSVASFDLVLRWRPRHLAEWATLDRFWLATDPLRCRGLIIAMAFAERRRRHPSGTVLPQRARSRPHPPPPF
jgi:hypothetical protein